MLNQTILVGRLVEKPTMENGVAEITIAVPRSYKNEEGVYETDFINCILNGVVATNTCEYCKKGDVVGIKGRLQNNDNQLVLMVEKVSFLSSAKRED